MPINTSERISFPFSGNENREQGLPVRQSDVSLDACRRCLYSTVCDEVAPRRSRLPPSACDRRINQRRRIFLPFFPTLPRWLSAEPNCSAIFHAEQLFVFLFLSSRCVLDDPSRRSDAISSDPRRFVPKAQRFRGSRIETFGINIGINSTRIHANRVTMLQNYRSGKNDPIHVCQKCCKRKTKVTFDFEF